MAVGTGIIVELGVSDVEDDLVGQARDGKMRAIVFAYLRTIDDVARREQLLMRMRQDFPMHVDCRDRGCPGKGA